MALIFARLARNFVKAGYFPTDDATLERLGNMLTLPEKGDVRMLDPCCGEGAALADIRQMLQANAAEAQTATAKVEALGIEFDSERAWHAKTLLDRVIHADMHDVVVKARSIGLLFLNPPYGYGVSDKENRSTAELHHERAERLERTFLKKTVPYLVNGGVLIYIIPHYALDEEIRHYLARNFDNLRIYMAPEQQFKQCVIVARKSRQSSISKATLETLMAAQASPTGAPELPETWEEEPYRVPPVHDGEINFHAVRMDEAQLLDELEKYQHGLLWPSLATHFNQSKGECRRPLRDLTPWHLALALAAGQVTGAIRSPEGRILLVKGDTYKKKERSAVIDVDEDGNVNETVTMLDRFVPVINAIEFTPGDRLGNIVKIA